MITIPEPPAPPATTSREASEEAVLQRLGPRTVPVAAALAMFALVTANVIVEPVVPVTVVNVPSKGAPTPLTMICDPTAIPCAAEVVSVAVLEVRARLVTV